MEQVLFKIYFWMTTRRAPNIFYSEIRDDCDNIDGVGSDKQSKD